ncbi:MAG: phospholipid carrier-dependent glycosyltransferase [Faecalibacterium sp.]
MLEQNKQKLGLQNLALILAVGFLLRIILAVSTEGYVYDVNCFFAWGARMADIGAANFYAEDYFCDYPPAYLFVLGIVGRLMSLFQVNYLEKLAQAFLVFVPSLADMGSAFLLYRIAHKAGNARLGLRLAAFVAFCPMFWYDTAVWKQIDGVLGLLMLGCFYLLLQKRFVPSAALYGLALAVKPQALIMGPVFGLCFLLPVFFAADSKAFWRAVKHGALGVLAALAPLYLTALPFFGFGNTFQSLIALYSDTAASYPYASINAFNFLAACGGNWVSQTEPFTIKILNASVSCGITWETFGTFAIAAMTVFIVVLALLGRKHKRFSAAFLAAVYMIGIFTFAHRMHERYLLVGVLLLLCAVAQLGSARLLALAGGLSITTLLNMAAVYTMVETDDAFFSSAMSILSVRLVGAAETILCLLLFYEAWQICSGKCRKVTLFGYDKTAPDAPLPEGVTTVLVGVAVGQTAARGKNEKQSGAAKTNAKTAKGTKANASMAKGAKANAADASQNGAVAKTEKAPYIPSPQPKWSKGEIIFLSVLMVAVSVLSFVYLGDLTAPQTSLDLRENTALETVVVEGDAAALWVYPAVTSSDASVLVLAEDGTVVLETTLAVGGLFQWESYPIVSYPVYTVIVSGVEMMELGFKDADGNLLSITTVDTAGIEVAPSAMFDEQSLIPDTISQLNSFYFDEIYHARTAYESVNGMDIYEISHPPMGKNFIALGVLIFGMTGFGWRFAGTLFGVLLVLVMYWFTRRLTRSPLVAGFVALLFSFDFMRYAQSRIATIDTISAFFILLGATCMLWYCQSVLEKGVTKSVLPMALAGLSFGFGAASKWTGLYAGVGLAILYFGVLCLRCYQEYFAAARANKQGDALEIFSQSKALRTEVIYAFGGGVLFFVVVPLIIYIASYLPYQLADPNFGLSGIWANQEYMLSYHSNLDATHPFSSPWYTWFLDLRPVWYYMGSGLEADTYASIAGFYNPVLCWVGAAAWLRLALRALKGKGTFVGNALIVLLLSQLMPWLLVTRCTFLYHYFPSFLFTMAAIGLWFQDLRSQNEERAYTLASGLLTLAIFFFVWFYPVLSGLPVGTLWAQTLKILPSFGFYIIS